MTRLSAIIGTIFLGMASLGAQTVPSPTNNAPTPFRTVHVTVLGLDGKPVPHRFVQLVGISRFSMRPDSATSPTPHWDFVTDVQGRFEVPFADFAPWEDPEHRPGWGFYALVVDPSPDDAGAVSSRIWFDSRPDQGRFGGFDEHDEWGDILDLPPQGLTLKLQIVPGITLKGRILDYAHPDQPLVDLTVAVSNDLHADTHTGYGGAILQHQAVTDADGRFTIRHIYPVRFDVGISNAAEDPAPGEVYCLKTKIGEKWSDTTGTEVVPKLGESVVHLELLASKTPLFRYFGKVLDESGHPIAEAKVVFGMSSHSPAKTWGDYHHYPETLTDKDGRYEIKLGTPWVRGMDAEASGFTREDRWDVTETTSYPPGEYNFTLKKN